MYMKILLCQKPLLCTLLVTQLIKSMYQNVQKTGVNYETANKQLI